MTSITKKNIFLLALFTLLLSTTSGCKDAFIKPESENKPVQTIPAETKEVTKIVYVEVDPMENNPIDFCTSQCSTNEINAQLNNFLVEPAPSHVYRWMEQVKRTEPQNLKEQIDSVNANQSGNNNTDLLSGIFLSLPKTGHRDTALAIKHLSNYAQNTDNNIHETTFLSLILSSLKERKRLIDDRYQLREQNALLQAQKSQQQIQTLKIKDQLNKIKEIEHLMYKKQLFLLLKVPKKPYHFYLTLNPIW